MRISGPNNPSSVERTQAPAAQPQSNGAARSGEARSGSMRESVEVSRTSQMLASARAAETPDPERIARLRAAIADGSFSMNSGAIADAMLREER